MAKKEDLLHGLDNLLDGAPKRRQREAPAGGEQMISGQERERRSRSGRKAAGDNRERLTANLSYTSLAIDKQLYAKLRQIARDNELPYKDLLNAAIRKYIELYEEKYGPVEISPESSKSADSLI